MALHEERRFSFLESRAVDRPVEVGVRESAKALLNLVEPQVERPPSSFLLISPLDARAIEPRTKEAPLSFGELKRGQRFDDGCFNTVFSDSCCGAGGCVAAVVDMSFLQLPDQRVATGFAREQPAEQEVTFRRLRDGLAAQDFLDTLESRHRYERRVAARKGLARAAKLDHPGVERVVENRRQAVRRDPAATPVPESKPKQLRG